MSISLQQLIENITFIYQKYLPGHEDSLTSHLNGAKGASELGIPLDGIYDGIIQSIFVASGYYFNAFPSAPYDLSVRDNREAYIASIDPGEVVDFFYPQASPADRGQLIEAINSGVISNHDFLANWPDVAQSNPTPSAKDVIETIIGETLEPNDGLTESQQDFLVGVYVAAFSRAPEHEGLEYWSGSLKHFLDQGMSEPDAFKQIARDMYWSGEQNGEAGTTLSNYDYAAYLYESVLGRQPDAKGLDYWFGQLESLNLGRNEFISVFLSSALAPGNGDGDYVRARVEVAKFVSQEYLSGPNGPGIDLVAILDGVTNAAQAQAVINGLIDTYGPGPAQAFAMSQAVAVDNTDLDIIMLQAQGFDDALYSDPYFDAQIESQDTNFIDVAGDTSYSYDLA